MELEVQGEIMEPVVVVVQHLVDLFSLEGPIQFQQLLRPSSLSNEAFFSEVVDSLLDLEQIQDRLVDEIFS